MTNEIATINNSDMVNFSDEDISRADLFLKCGGNKPLIIKALAIQHATGLSMARGEISILQFNGQPTITINKQGYLAYAASQPNYEGYEWGFKNEDKPIGDLKAWVKIYCTGRRPTYEEIDFKEFSKQSPVWRQMPKHMLKVRCLSLALRDAFPILSGTLTPDEIEDASFKIEPRPTDIDVQPEPVKPPLAPISYPAPAQQPVKTYTATKSNPDEIKTTAVYTAEQVTLSILPNYQANKLNTDIIAKAILPNGMYDKTMIDADYKAQMFSPKPEPQPELQPQPEPHAESGLDEFTAEMINDATENHKRTIDQPFCVDCGNTRVLPEEEKASRAKYGVALCPDCLSKRIASDLKAKQESKEAKELAKAGEDALQNLVKASATASTPAPAKPKQTKPTATASENVCEVCGKKLTTGDIAACKMFTPGHLFCEDHRIEYAQSRVESKNGGSQ